MPLLPEQRAQFDSEGWVIVEAEQDPTRANPFEYAKKGYTALASALTGAGYEISA